MASEEAGSFFGGFLDSYAQGIMVRKERERQREQQLTQGRMNLLQNLAGNPDIQADPKAMESLLGMMDETLSGRDLVKKQRGGARGQGQGQGQGQQQMGHLQMLGHALIPVAQILSGNVQKKELKPLDLGKPQTTAPESTIQAGGIPGVLPDQPRTVAAGGVPGTGILGALKTPEQRAQAERQIAIADEQAKVNARVANVEGMKKRGLFASDLDYQNALLEAYGMKSTTATSLRGTSRVWMQRAGDPPGTWTPVMQRIEADGLHYIKRNLDGTDEDINPSEPGIKISSTDPNKALTAPDPNHVREIKAGFQLQGFSPQEVDANTAAYLKAEREAKLKNMQLTGSGREQQQSIISTLGFPSAGAAGVQLPFSQPGVRNKAFKGPIPSLQAETTGGVESTPAAAPAAQPAPTTPTAPTPSGAAGAGADMRQPAVTAPPATAPGGGAGPRAAAPRAARPGQTAPQAPQARPTVAPAALPKGTPMLSKAQVLQTPGAEDQLYGGGDLAQKILDLKRREPHVRLALRQLLLGGRGGTSGGGFGGGGAALMAAYQDGLDKLTTQTPLTEADLANEIAARYGLRYGPGGLSTLEARSAAYDLAASFVTQMGEALQEAKANAPIGDNTFLNSIQVWINTNFKGDPPTAALQTAVQGFIGAYARAISNAATSNAATREGATERATTIMRAAFSAAVTEAVVRQVVDKEVPREKKAIEDSVQHTMAKLSVPFGAIARPELFPKPKPAEPTGAPNKSIDDQYIKDHPEWFKH